ncbi:hypothetical protein BURPSS13_C0023 [Burkholderia pseudomallei S13]|nr:hypothetical protein BURPSS13_C0023 [Burkholderia pseudomallei S13]
MAGAPGRPRMRRDRRRAKRRFRGPLPNGRPCAAGLPASPSRIKERADES